MNLIRTLLLSALTAPSWLAAQAQFDPDAPMYESTLSELAGVLGQSHAIHVICNGQKDQYWRDYMWVLLELEASEPGPRRSSLVEAFNAGYAGEQARFSFCNQPAQIELSELTKRGRELADNLSALNTPQD